MKTSIILTFLSIAAIIAVPCFAGEIETVDGYIAQIDDIGSKLVVNTGSEEIPFIVSDSASITRGTEDISLSDIEINDSVTVHYRKNTEGKNEATSIIDNNLANE
jgi:hypothetical protein